MDGDFYKWLEAAIARLETDPDPELAARVEQIAQLIASVQREDGYLHTPTIIAEPQRRGRRSRSPTASTSRPTTSATSSPRASATTR